MKAPAVIGERLIDAHCLARHLFPADIDTKIGCEISKCAGGVARRAKGMIHDHKPISGANLPHGECLTISEQNALRITKDPRSGRAEQHHH